MTDGKEPVRSGMPAAAEDTDREAGYPAPAMMGWTTATAHDDRWEADGAEQGRAADVAANRDERSARENGHGENGHGMAESATRPDVTAKQTGHDASSRIALMPDADADTYRNRWEAVQGAFVDDPRTAVMHADALVAEVMQQLTSRFTEERTRLEAQWTSGGDAGTEELRVALQRYRSFFHRLLER